MILHGLTAHLTQPGDGGVQLTEVVMSLSPLGWSHCRVTVSHDRVVAATLVGGGSGSGATGSRAMNKRLILELCTLQLYYLSAESGTYVHRQMI